MLMPNVTWVSYATHAHDEITLTLSPLSFIALSLSIFRVFLEYGTRIWGGVEKKSVSREKKETLSRGVQGEIDLS